MNFPAELKYTADHEWIRVEGDTAVVGITDFAQKELGDIVYLDIQSVGDSLDAGEVFGSVEAVKTVSDLFMPVAGEVAEVNQALEANPELVNQDPYGDGWLVKIKLADAGNTGDLMDAEAYKGTLNLD